MQVRKPGSISRLKGSSGLSMEPFRTRGRIVFRKEIADAIGPIDTEVGPFADGGYVWRAGARFPFVVRRVLRCAG